MIQIDLNAFNQFIICFALGLWPYAALWVYLSRYAVGRRSSWFFILIAGLPTWTVALWKWRQDKKRQRYTPKLEPWISNRHGNN